MLNYGLWMNMSLESCFSNSDFVTKQTNGFEVFQQTVDVECWVLVRLIALLSISYQSLSFKVAGSIPAVTVND